MSADDPLFPTTANDLALNYGVCKFVSQLFWVIRQCETNGIGSFTDDGFIITHPEDAWVIIEAGFPTTGNLALTFARQLNLYGFKLVARPAHEHQKDVWKQNKNPTVWRHEPGLFNKHATLEGLRSLKPKVPPRKKRGHHPSECKRKGFEYTCARCRALASGLPSGPTSHRKEYQLVDALMEIGSRGTDTDGVSDSSDDYLPGGSGRSRKRGARASPPAHQSLSTLVSTVLSNADDILDATIPTSAASKSPVGRKRGRKPGTHSTVVTENPYSKPRLSYRGNRGAASAIELEDKLGSPGREEASVAGVWTSGEAGADAPRPSKRARKQAPASPEHLIDAAALTTNARVAQDAESVQEAAV